MMNANACSIVVLVSGQGTNLQAIIDAINAGDIPAQLSAVVSNRPGALGLQRARNANIPTVVLDHSSYADRADFDAQLIKQIDNYQPDLVVLAGYMRILSDAFVTHYRGRLINIHPSLLPAYRGLHTHRRVLEAEESYHGTSVHYVNEELDGGPIVAQAKLEITRSDNENTLLQRIQMMEHRLYPLVIKLIATKKLRYENNQVVYKDLTLDTPLQFEEHQIELNN